MNHSSRFSTRIASQLITLRVLVTELRRRLQLLEADISDEEKRTRVFDVQDVNYSLLAKTSRARRDNTLATICALEASVSGGFLADQPQDRAA